MNIKTFEFNPLGVNTYVLSDETKECAVIDPAALYAEEKELLLGYLLDNGLKVKYLLVTHLHFDHIFGVKWLASQSGASVRCHRDDLFLLDNISGQMQAFGFPGGDAGFTPEIDSYLNDGDVIVFGNQSVRVFHTPGHSPGSVVYYNEAESCVFSGDLLFCSGVGRTDLPGGSYGGLADSIETKMFALPDSTVVYPGHGPATTIGFEKKNNPFVGK
jgi:glyoxylase-like metal-dependent hydrolase (beta-lactamase superfamily II)